MKSKMTITVEPADPEMIRRSRLFRRNGIWMSENGAALYDQYPGQYVAVSEGEIFNSFDAQEAKRLALENHPDDIPFVIYLPKEKYERIYAS
jgi:hypothetical protein